MSHFIGRKTELEELAALLSLRSANLRVVKGRRRIGKSRLLSEFAKYFDKAYIFSGLAPEKDVTAEDQRNEFARQMRRFRIAVTNPNDWGDLLTDLAQHCKKGRNCAG